MSEIKFKYEQNSDTFRDMILPSFNDSMALQIEDVLPKFTRTDINVFAKVALRHLHHGLIPASSKHLFGQRNTFFRASCCLLYLVCAPFPRSRVSVLHDGYVKGTNS